jgi:hypothetical protein
MRTKPLLATVAVVVAGVGTGVARADQPPHEFAGQPFYFTATCTGIGDVLLVNQSLANTAALRIVGGHGIVLLGKPGIERRADAECTLTGGGFSPATIEPFDEPFASPAVIVDA